MFYDSPEFKVDQFCADCVACGYTLRPFLIPTGDIFYQVLYGRHHIGMFFMESDKLTIGLRVVSPNSKDKFEVEYHQEQFRQIAVARKFIE